MTGCENVSVRAVYSAIPTSVSVVGVNDDEPLDGSSTLLPLLALYQGSCQFLAALKHLYVEDGVTWNQSEK